jgi:hydrogenase maturation protease
MNFEEFRQELDRYREDELIFVGLGNDYRGDDAAGLIFVDRLNEISSFKASHFIRAGTNPENYLQEILDSKAQIVVFVDAARYGAKPGEINWLDAGNLNNVDISTHAFSIKMIEKYLTLHKKLQFRYVGIEPQSTKLGSTLSKSVADKLDCFFKDHIR